MSRLALNPCTPPAEGMRATPAEVASAQRGLDVAGLGGAPLPVWTRFLPPGHMVVREGERGSSMFVIVEGRVAVVRERGVGAPRTVAQLSAGEFFGEMALMTDCPRTATVVTLGRTVLRELSRSGLAMSGARHGVEGPVVTMRCRERFLADAVRSSPLLATLSPDLWHQLGSALVPCSVPEGETLLARGTPGNALFVLLRGRCSVFHTHLDGHTTPYPDMEEGSIFGEVSLLRGRVATATVRAATPCTLLRLEREVFRKFFWAQADFRRALVRLGLSRMNRTMALITG